jgi:hypothetical protein
VPALRLDLLEARPPEFSELLLFHEDADLALDLALTHLAQHHSSVTAV